MELPVSVRLSSIYCRDEGDGPGDAEPYLWTIFFKIDGQNIHQNGIALAGDAAFSFGVGSHNNLNNHDVTSGERVAIPAPVGRWETTLTPITISDFSGNNFFMPGIIGVAAILMEEDNVSDSGAEAGHKALNTFVQTSINDFIHSINLLDFADPNTRKEILDARIEALKKELVDRSGAIVHDAIVNKQPWYSDLWAWVNADDKIGSQIWIFNQDDIVSKRYHLDLHTRWRNHGDWELSGAIDAPNPCQRQLDAVNRQKAIIAGVEKVIRQLQEEFRKAPAAMKPAIREEIELVKTEQLQPAKEQLKPLLQALAMCYNRPFRRPDVLSAGKTGPVLRN